MHRLAELVGGGDEIQGVVGHLESHPQVVPERLDLVAPRRRDAADDCADFAACRKQRSRFERDNAVILRLADAQVALLQRFDHLALGHLDGHVGHRFHHQMVLVGQRQRHRLGVEVIADQDGDFVAPQRVNRRIAAPQLGVVHDVVVQQGGGVDELDDGAEVVHARAVVAAQAGRQDEQRRADALAAAGQDVLCGLRDEGNVGVQMPGDGRFDLLQVGFDKAPHFLV